MEAKDTVIVNTSIIEYHKKLFPWMYQGNDDDWCEEQLHRLITLSESKDVQLLLDCQAEISYKAGYEQAKKEDLITTNDLISDSRKAGMQVVVEFVDTHRPLGFFSSEWRAFLKENGLVKK